MNKEVTTYNNQQEAHFKAVCDMLCEAIWQYLPNAKGKIWHGSPVWFLEDLQRWLRKSEEIQWDYKNIVKRRGILERLT